MVSAVSSRFPSISPDPAPGGVREQAAAGYFRAIALWLNEPLATQGIYVQVQADKPGCLRLLVEFEHPPFKEHLIRFLCHRIWLLQSPLIEGIHVIARPVGHHQILWQRKIRIMATGSPIAAQAAISQPPIAPASTPQAPPPKRRMSPPPRTPHPSHSQRPPLPRSPMPPPLGQRQPLRRQGGQQRQQPIAQPAVPPTATRRGAKTAPQAVKPSATSVRSPLPPLIKSQTPRSGRGLFALVGEHLKTFRALVLTGSAVAAFIFGCLVEAMLSGGSPTLPTFSGDRSDEVRVENSAQPVPLENQPTNRRLVPWGKPAQPGTEVTQVNYAPDTPTGAARPPVVDTAVEPVAVMPHTAVLEPGNPEVTLLFGGDISLEEIPYDQPEKVEHLFDRVVDYQQADVSLINLDAPLASAATSLAEELHNRNRVDAVNFLKQGGVDIVNLTSEQVMTFGAEGLAEALDSLDGQGMYRVGAGRNEQEARRPEILDVKGKRIAYLSYAQGGDHAAHGDRAGVNAQGELEIAADIRALRDEVDWIIVNYRWQTDIPATPADWQTNLGRLAIEQGADLFVGYHPSTLQGGEIYRGRPIIYSLGDFIFQDSPPKEQDTALLKVSLQKEQMRVEFVPIQVNNAQPEVAKGKAARQILRNLERSAAGFDKPLRSPVILRSKSNTPVMPPANPNSSFVAPAGSPTDSSTGSPDPAGSAPPVEVWGEPALENEVVSPSLPVPPAYTPGEAMPADAFAPESNPTDGATPGEGFPEAGDANADYLGDSYSGDSYSGDSYSGDSYSGEGFPGGEATESFPGTSRPENFPENPSKPFPRTSPNTSPENLDRWGPKHSPNNQGFTPLPETEAAPSYGMDAWPSPSEFGGEVPQESWQPEEAESGWSEGTDTFPEEAPWEIPAGELEPTDPGDVPLGEMDPTLSPGAIPIEPIEVAETSVNEVFPD